MLENFIKFAYSRIFTQVYIRRIINDHLIIQITNTHLIFSIMKKLLSLVLICAMGFGMISCVESEESQSVRDIRDAKAKQLKALAELSRAQAQARIIEAEAEAAYDKAYAAYQQALADEKQNSIEQSKAKFAYEIEKIKAEYEAAMLEAMKEAKGYEKDILEMADNKIKSLYATYNDYVTKLNTANSNLLKNKVNLAQVEAEIIDITEAANKEIEDNTALVEELEAQLAILTDNAYTQMDKDSLTNEYLKALAAFNDADYKYKSTEVVAYKKAKEAAEKASDDYINDYNNKVAEMDALEGGIVASVKGDKVWTDEKPRVDFDIVYFAYAYVDTDNDPTTPDEQIIVDTDSPLWDRDWDNVVEHNGHYAIKYINNRRIETDYKAVFEHLEVFINETPLLKFKTASAGLYKTEVDNLDKYTKDLETATAQETAVKGFEAAFKKAGEAAKAIKDYNDALDNYNELSETVAVKEDLLKQAITDTTGLHTAIKTNTKAVADADKALKDAKDALTTAEKALASAAEADKATKQQAVNDAKAVVAQKEKALYDAQVALVGAEKNLADAEKEIKDAKADVEKAKENEAALLAANTAAQAAVETLKGLFGENGEFRAFMFDEDGLWTGPDGTSNYNFSNAGVNLLTDKNDDDNPDMVMDANGNKNGLYESEMVTYPFFGSVDNGGNIVPFEDYAAEFTKFSAHYTKAVAVATDNVSKANKTIAELKDWVSDWDAKEAELRAWVEAKNAEIAEVRAAYEEFTKAEDANEAAKKNVDALQAEYQALSTLLTSNGNDDLKNKISEIEGKITTAETAIKDAKLVLANLKTAKPSWSNNYQTIAYKEQLVEQYKAEIAKYEEEIKFYTQMVANAKAALDAELSAQNAE